MMEANVNPLFQRLDQFELDLCLMLNRSCHRQTLRRFFAIISRLGNGVFWYTLMLLIPLVAGPEAIWISMHMGLVGVAGLMVYKVLKKRLVRERPFFTHPGILLGTAPLDKFSFPSGHTLHAVGFTIVACSYFPSLAVILVPFALLTAMSRIVLGLHYPSDVLAGAAIGAAIATLSFIIIG
jgi:undecaprenyl-diphosphatase